MTISQHTEDRPDLAVVPCPAWCAYGPHASLDVHVSAAVTAPAAGADHYCHTAADMCGEDIAAQLVQDGRGVVTLEITHGAMECLPAMTPGAAESLALGILALVATAAAGAVRSIPCPLCCAQPGEDCGLVPAGLHFARWAQARRQRLISAGQAGAAIDSIGVITDLAMVTLGCAS